MRVSARAQRVGVREGGGVEQTERESSRLRSLTEHVRVHPLLHPPSHPPSRLPALQNKGFSAVTMCAGGLPDPPTHPYPSPPPLFCLVSTLRPPALLFPAAAATAGEVTWYSNLSPALLLLHDIPRAQMRADWKGDSAEWLRDTAKAG